MDYRISYGVILINFMDLYWASSVVDRKRTFGCSFSFGSTVVSWFKRKQKSVALSSIEAEYMASSQATCKALWLRKLLVDLFDQELRPTLIYCYNQSCIQLSENLVFHDLSKHIEIRYHFIRDYVHCNDIAVHFH